MAIIKVWIKAKDPPWDAVLMGSVASTIFLISVYRTMFCAILLSISVFSFPDY